MPGGSSPKAVSCFGKERLGRERTLLMDTEPPPSRATGRERVNREVKDLLLKRLATLLRGDFPPFLGLNLPAIVAVLSNELPVLEVRAEYPDLVLRLADGS